MRQELTTKVALQNSVSVHHEKPWSIREVAAYTGYAIGTLYNLTAENLIPHRKKRGKLYFERLEIQKWIEEGNLE